jgi:FkbM family methyltransferase
MRKLVLRATRAAIICLAVFAVVLVGVRIALPRYVGLVSVPLVLAGRYDKACTSVASIRGAFTKSVARAEVARIRNQSKLIATDGQYDHWQTPLGLYWVPSDTSSVLPVLLGQQAADEYGTVNPGDIVLDCGAHVGVFTREALDMGAAKVIAIEPSPENLECLRRNFMAEIAAKRVVVYPTGVWNEDTVLKLQRVKGNSAGNSFVMQVGEADSVGLPLTTIDKLVGELQLGRVDLIKMDIKGAERQALTGAKSTLSRFAPRLAVAAEHLAGDAEVLPGIVRAAHAGYEVRCGCASITANFVHPEILFLAVR